MGEPASIRRTRYMVMSRAEMAKDVQKAMSASFKANSPLYLDMNGRRIVLSSAEFKHIAHNDAYARKRVPLDELYRVVDDIKSARYVGSANLKEGDKKAKDGYTKFHYFSFKGKDNNTYYLNVGERKKKFVLYSITEKIK